MRLCRRLGGCESLYDCTRLLAFLKPDADPLNMHLARKCDYLTDISPSK